MNTGNLLARALYASLLVLCLQIGALAQGASGDHSSGSSRGSEKPVNLKVTKVDDETVKPLLVAKGKPLLVNFWATWCEPCRQEFPELVEIDKKYDGKIDFIIISLDDPVEIDRDVPKFLKEMGSTMTSYLLRTDDETAVIGSISDSWQGGLPFTVLYDADGNIRHARQGLIKVPIVTSIIDQLISRPKGVAVTELVKVVDGNLEEAVFYFRNNWQVLRDEAIKRGMIESYEMQVAKAGEESDFDIVLITRYRNNLQYGQAEQNFRKFV